MVAAILAVAYLGIYPRMEPKSLKRMMKIDLVLGLVMLGIAGSVYFGTGIRFSLLIGQTYWWVFTLLVAFFIEIPLFMWFCKKWGIDPTNLDDD